MKKIFIYSALSALTAAVSLSMPSFADDEKGRRSYGGEAVVFKDPNFRGAALSIDAPIYNMRYAGFNDTISSIDVRGTWEICVDPDFRGKCEIIQGSQSRLTHIRMNDNISSMRPVTGRATTRGNGYGYGSGGGYQNNQHGNYAGIQLYRDLDFTGRSIGLDDGVTNLREIGFNDTISSIIVNSGQWLVCEHPDYRGRCEVIYGSVYDVRDIGLNDRISSVTPYNQRRYSSR